MLTRILLFGSIASSVPRDAALVLLAVVGEALESLVHVKNGAQGPSVRIAEAKVVSRRRSDYAAAYDYLNAEKKVQNVRKNVYYIIISPIYHKIKAEKQLQWIYLNAETLTVNIQPIQINESFVRLPECRNING